MRPQPGREKEGRFRTRKSAATQGLETAAGSSEDHPDVIGQDGIQEFPGGRFTARVRTAFGYY